jgi:hypothetical protein
MKNHRMTIPALALLVTFAASPGVAAASSLLSGYGGPGQGSQAILGSTLVNGPRGGGGSGGSSGSTGSLSAITAPASTAPSTAGSVTAGGKAASKATRGGAKGHARGHAPSQTSTDASSPYIVSRQVAEPFLGISKGDFLGIIAVAAALIVIGVATWRSARTDAGTRVPKGTGPGNRASG